MTKEEALKRLMQECSRSEKSVSFVNRKLKDWGLTEFSKEITDKLRTEKFIDDARYVKAFIHDKIVFNKWGKFKIRYQLLSEKIAESIINTSLKEFDKNEYKNIIFEELRKKQKSLKNMPHQNMKSKLMSFGSQRGYEMDIIRDFLNED